MRAIAEGRAPESVLAQITLREGRIKEIEREMESPSLLDELSDARLAPTRGARDPLARSACGRRSPRAAGAARPPRGPILFAPERGATDCGCYEIGALWEPEVGAAVTRVKMASQPGVTAVKGRSRP